MSKTTCGRCNGYGVYENYHTGVEYACELCIGKKPEQRNTAPREYGPIPIRPELRQLAQLREEYAQAAGEAAQASADIALYEAKVSKAKAKYEECKRKREELKRQIAEHPEA
jgi:hypothetical protein